uniref:G_PROTEIN_RECEP_F1_2 domain-containing protein n=1 Tax=Ascaris lumbricoides TaxID=6252 RepID=A0A0M3HS71_ASCLU
MLMNCSDPRSYPRAVMSSSAYLTAVCYCICFCIALVGNFTMFVILVRNQIVKVRRVHTLLLHMNVAHLVVTLIYMPKEIIHNITVAWWGGDLATANILICISLDRFYSIFSPLYTLNAKKCVRRMVLIAWIISFVTSLPSAFLFRTSSHPCAHWYTQCVSGDFIGAIPHEFVFAYTIVNLMQVYLIPLFFIVACYSLILYKISSKTTSSTSYASNNGPKLRRSGEANLERAKSRTLKMTFVIVLAFLLCWTPYAAASFIHFTYRPSPIPPLIRKLIYAFAVFNAAISPYLYGYFSFDLKKELLLLSKCSNTELSDRQLSVSNFVSGRYAFGVIFLYEDT